jgi:hypothetical protein
MNIIVKDNKGQSYFDRVEAVARKGDFIIFDQEVKEVKSVVWYPDYDYIKTHHTSNIGNITAFIWVE